MNHFLDTSIFTLFFRANPKIQAYLDEDISGKKYISSYILMEFINGFIKRCIEFYGYVDSPQSETVIEAVEMWNENFSSRDLKVVSSLFTNMFQQRKINLYGIRSKEKAKKHIAEYINRLHSMASHLFANIGTDEELCSKMKAEWRFDPSDPSESFRLFKEAFEQKENTDTCRIRELLARHVADLGAIEAEKGLRISGSSPKGFIGIVSAIEEYNPSKHTCRKCHKLGDLIISLEAPENMRIEHTDQSFDYLTRILAKDHKRHPAPIKIMKREA